MTKIEEFIEQGKKLHNSNFFAPDFTAWRNTVICFLKRKYGEKSQVVRSFVGISYYLPCFGRNHPQNRMIFLNGLKTAILYLKGYQTNNTEKNESKNTTNTVSSNEIFIVHGRNDGIRAQVENLLSKLKIKPIILQEQTNRGLTIIEKFVDNSDVKAAIVLFTRDDIGKLKEEDTKLEDRARQNVVFEAGFFIGKLGRNNTIILLERGLTLPSDLDGVGHIELDSGKWKYKVADELKGLGFDIDKNLI